MESENKLLWERLDKEIANGEVLEMKLDDMRYEKANLIDRAHNEFKWLRAQFEAEKAEIRRFHQLQLKQRSDEIEGKKINYTYYGSFFISGKGFPIVSHAFFTGLVTMVVC